jgi:hypothetical protein
MLLPVMSLSGRVTADHATAGYATAGCATAGAALPLATLLLTLLLSKLLLAKQLLAMLLSVKLQLGRVTVRSATAGCATAGYVTASHATAGHAVDLRCYRIYSKQRPPATLRLAQLQVYAVSMSEEINKTGGAKTYTDYPGRILFHVALSPIHLIAQSSTGVWRETTSVSKLLTRSNHHALVLDSTKGRCGS